MRTNLATMCTLMVLGLLACLGTDVGNPAEEDDPLAPDMAIDAVLPDIGMDTVEDFGWEPVDVESDMAEDTGFDLPTPVGQLEVSWTILVGEELEPGTCPLEPAAVELQLSTAGDDEIIRQVPCEDGLHRFESLSLGDYQLRLRLLDLETERLLASPPSSELVLADSVESLNIDIALDRGFLLLTWTIRREEEVLSCSDAAAHWVKLEAQSGQEPVHLERLACQAEQPHLASLGLGEHSLEFTLLDLDDNPLATTAASQISLEYGNQVLALPEIVFELDGE